MSKSSKRRLRAVSARVSPDRYDQLLELAEVHGTSVSAILRRLITTFLLRNPTAVYRTPSTRGDSSTLNRSMVSERGL
jgi:hypothetical protein